MGACAAEWMFGDPSDEDCDGLTLSWRTHQVATPAKLPETRTVVHLVLTGAGGAQGWLDIQRPDITVSKDDQGLAVDLALQADTAQMHRWLARLGDEVFGSGAGTFAEYAVAATTNVVPKPTTITFEQAAAVPMSGLTALQVV